MTSALHAEGPEFDSQQEYFFGNRIEKSLSRCGGSENPKVSVWPCGAMDSALDFGSSGCGFESHQGRIASVAQLDSASDF